MATVLDNEGSSFDSFDRNMTTEHEKDLPSSTFLTNLEPPHPAHGQAMAFVSPEDRLLSTYHSPHHIRQDVRSFSVPVTPAERCTSAKPIQTVPARLITSSSTAPSELLPSPTQAIQEADNRDSLLTSPGRQNHQTWATELIDSLPVPQPPRRLASPINLSLPSGCVPARAFAAPNSPIANKFIMPPDGRFTLSAFAPTHRRSQSAFSNLGQTSGSRSKQSVFSILGGAAEESTKFKKAKKTKRRKTVSFAMGDEP